jgi:hypothetical protein
LQAK